MIVTKRKVLIFFLEVLLVAVLSVYLFGDRNYLSSEGYVENAWCETYSKGWAFLFLEMRSGEKVLLPVTKYECDSMIKYYIGRYVSYEYESDSGLVSEMEYRGKKRFTKNKAFWADFGFCVAVFLLVNGAAVSAVRAIKK